MSTTDRITRLRALLADATMDLPVAASGHARRAQINALSKAIAALPALLDVAEAARDLVRCESGEAAPFERPCRRHGEKLAAALRALEGGS